MLLPPSRSIKQFLGLMDRPQSCNAMTISRPSFRFTWSVCFADIGYVAFIHPQMRAEEQHLHQANHQSWIGFGEWFYFSTHQRNSIEQRYVIRLRNAGVKARQQDRAFGHRSDVICWRQLRLVTIHDIFYNFARGRISWSIGVIPYFSHRSTSSFISTL